MVEGPHPTLPLEAHEDTQWTSTTRHRLVNRHRGTFTVCVRCQKTALKFLSSLPPHSLSLSPLLFVFLFLSCFFIFSLLFNVLAHSLHTFLNYSSTVSSLLFPTHSLSSSYFLSLSVCTQYPRSALFVLSFCLVPVDRSSLHAQKTWTSTLFSK